MPAALRPFAPRVLHDMVREYPHVRRICKGLYWRGDDAADAPLFDRRIRSGFAGIAYAGAGSGFAHVSALNVVGWSSQVPPRAVITAAAGRCPEADIAGVDFVSSSNPRRQALTWAEVTLLEAVRHSDWAEPSPDYQLSESRPPLDWRSEAWHRAVERLRDGRVLGGIGRGAVLRGPALAAAAATEPRPPRWFASRMAEAVAVIGDRLAHHDPTPPVRYAVPPAPGDPFAPR